VSGRPPLILAAVLVATMVGGCGQQSTQRAAVAGYVKQVNSIESALAAPLREVTDAGSQFSTEQRPSEKSIFRIFSLSPEQALQKAWLQIRVLRARLAAIRTPTAAEHLRALLLELIDSESAMTREVAELVAFLPGYNAALGALGPAEKQLEVVLSQQSAYGPAAVSAVYAAKAAALRQFHTETDAMLAQLRRLRPPAVSKPGYNAQLASLRGMSAGAGRLATALAAGALTGIGPVMAQFDRAAATSNTVAVRRAEITAARAYDSRSATLDVLSQKVALERLRLSNTLH